MLKFPADTTFTGVRWQRPTFINACELSLAEPNTWSYVGKRRNAGPCADSQTGEPYKKVVRLAVIMVRVGPSCVTTKKREKISHVNEIRMVILICGVIRNEI